ARGDCGDAGGHALQNQPIGREPGYQPQNFAGKAQEVRFEIMRLRLVMLGKTRRPEVRTLIDDYVKRISRSAPIEVTELRETEAALKKLAFDQPCTIVLLDD